MDFKAPNPASGVVLDNKGWPVLTGRGNEADYIKHYGGVRVFSQSEIDAAIAADRERWAATCERLADALEARLGTNAEEWADVRAARMLLGRA